MIDRQFIVEKQGKQFALLAGLIDAAHRDGLKELSTELLLVGSEANGMTWLFKATATTEKGTFTGHGDASPSNVSRQMLTVLPRMAESRAVARALRFAVNAGALVALEELSDDDIPTTNAAPVHHEPERPNRPTAPPPAPRPAPQAPVPQSQPTNITLATPAQVRALYSIGRERHNLSEREVDERAFTLFGAAPVDLTRKQASDMITALKG